MKIIFEGTLFFIFYFWKIEIGGRWWDEGDLHEIDVHTIRKNKRMEEGMCKTLEELEELATRRGYKKGWAIVRWNARQAKRKVDQW